MSKEKANSQNTKKSTAKKSKKDNNVEEKVTKAKTKSKDTKKDTKKQKNSKPEKEVKRVIEEEIIEEVEIDEDYDEDLEGSYTEEIEEVKKISKKNETPKETISKEKIKKIEKIAKEKKKKNKNNSSKLKELGNFLELHLNIITSFIVGVLITALIALAFWPERIAELKDGTESIVKVGKTTYTADELYKEMKSSYSVSKLLDIIDNDLLTKMYPEDDEMTEEVKSNAEYYLNMYKQYYNYTEEQFLSANGFANYDAFLEYLKLDYRRGKYLDEYIENNLSDKEIEDYYNENVYGDINCQHILVETSSDSSSDSDDNDSDSKKLSDDDAKKLAEEIIDKINDGTSWDEIKKKYKDKVTFEDLGYQSWDSDLEDSFKNALKDMDNKSFSEEPVKTSYGYHVIYRLDQKEAPTLKKTKEKIIEKLIEKKKSDDENLQYKALISLRDKKKIDFKDTEMASKYETYKKQYK